jgi:cyclomaltodextrinase / maltogenic alpha-amylase / neopullulanase
MTYEPLAKPRPNGPDWVRDAVFYQIFPDRFASSRRVPKPGALERWDAPPTTHGFKGGDLLGIAEHLDELHDLGITALYLTPVFASASNHRYHTFDYEFVDPLLGGDVAFRELLDAAHSRDMRVILDGVFNHASRGFWPFHHVLENGDSSPYRDWFYLDAEVRSGKRGLVAYPGTREADEIHRIHSGAGPSAQDISTASHPPESASAAHHEAAETVEEGPFRSASERVLGYQAWWDLPALPKLNHSNPAVCEYIYGVAERWLRFGIDGWRLDVPEEIGEPGFWEEFRRRCLAVKPDAYLVGEIWQPAPTWLAGGRFHGLMNYPLAEAILSFVGAGRLDEALVAKTHEYVRHVRPIDGPEFGRQLAGVMATYSPEVTTRQLNLLDSHDTPRFISLAGGDAASLRLAALIQMTLPGAPCVYYGDEMGLEGREDPDCRRAYPWDPARQNPAMRDFYAGLIALRHAESVVRNGRFELLGAADSAVAFGLIGLEKFDRSMVVAVNAGDHPARLELELSGLAGLSVTQVGWPGNGWQTTFEPRAIDVGRLVVELEAREGIVLGVGGSR